MRRSTMADRWKPGNHHVVQFGFLADAVLADLHKVYVWSGGQVAPRVPPRGGHDGAVGALQPAVACHGPHVKHGQGFGGAPVKMAFQGAAHFQVA